MAIQLIYNYNISCFSSAQPKCQKDQDLYFLIDATISNSYQDFCESMVVFQIIAAAPLALLALSYMEYFFNLMQPIQSLSTKCLLLIVIAVTLFRIVCQCLLKISLHAKRIFIRQDYTSQCVPGTQLLLMV